MSEQLRHKMINYETPPPNAVWNAIAERLEDDKQYAVVSIKVNHFEEAPPSSAWETIVARLDDDKQYAAVASRLNDFETTPPQSAWETIVARLDDDKQYASVAARLNNFEEIPPSIVWDNVTTRLSDDGQHNNVSAKLQHFTAVPPPEVWNNIAEALVETKEDAKPVINIRTTIYRIAAAAILTGFFIGGWLLINKNTKNDLVKNNQKITPADQTIKENNKNAPVNNSASQKVEPIASLNQPIHNTKEKNFAATASITETGNDVLLKHAVVNDLLTYQEKPIVIHSAPILDKEGNVIADLDVLTTSNYIVVMGPNGQSTRISSKFASVIRFLNSDDPAGTEEYLDKVIKESDTWKKRFQEWRSKISQSSFIPSASNFLDIVEFKELIEEKQ